MNTSKATEYRQAAALLSIEINQLKQSPLTEWSQFQISTMSAAHAKLMALAWDAATDEGIWNAPTRGHSMVVEYNTDAERHEKEARVWKVASDRRWALHAQFCIRSAAPALFLDKMRMRVLVSNYFETKEEVSSMA